METIALNGEHKDLKKNAGLGEDLLVKLVRGFEDILADQNAI